MCPVGHGEARARWQSSGRFPNYATICAGHGSVTSYFASLVQSHSDVTSYKFNDTPVSIVVNPYVPPVVPAA